MISGRFVLHRCPTPLQARDALLRRAYLELYVRYCELEVDAADYGAGAPVCTCGPDDPCPAHRTHALLVEIYSLLEGGQEETHG